MQEHGSQPFWTAPARHLRIGYRIRQAFFLIGVQITLAAVPSHAVADPSEVCDRAALMASRDSDVPLDVLLAITLTETGRARGGSTRPWPWTVNMEGKGVWFETEDDARAYVYEHFKRGARSFDVGCFQLNYKWHHQGFSSLDEMFDPIAGGNYAANFLKDLFAETGDWEKAAGAYHSRTPEHAERYLASFRQHRAGLGDTPVALASLEPDQTDYVEPQSTSAPAIRERVNTFPLLQSGGSSRSAGSLVPLGKTTTSRLIDFNGAG